jgi:hypothetical protein
MNVLSAAVAVLLFAVSAAVVDAAASHPAVWLAAVAAGAVAVAYLWRPLWRS